MPIYSDTIIVKTLTITSGETSSELFDCGALYDSDGNGGASALQRITLPDNFTAANLTFKVANINDILLAAPLYVTDGSSASGLVTVQCDGSALQTIQLNPAWFNAVRYFSFVSSVAQVETVNIDLVFQPIYQGYA